LGFRRRTIIVITDRFADALSFAEHLHRTQTRKGNDIPYIAHLMQVAATVLEWGGDEDTAIAALLHDAVEDQGGQATADLITARFGDRVTRIVLACTDSMTDDPAKKLPWEARKQTYVAKLPQVSSDIAQVVAADKLHNVNSMIRDIKRDGLGTLARFSAGPDRLVWYFLSIADALAPHTVVAPIDELRVGAETLAQLVHRNRSEA